MSPMAEIDVSAEFYDVLIIGAGLSGINAAYRVQEQMPEAKYLILEGRDRLGGTWDLFKYPGIRSDSDLYTFGFPWYPWPYPNVIADGPSIVDYMKDAASKFGIDKHIEYHQRVLAANWSSEAQDWTIQVAAGEKPRTFKSRFVICCTGYYDYNEPLKARIPGLANFEGQVIHPQFWPEDLDYSGKKMIVIGSGATAITLLPALAKKADHVTMIQRSPTYVLSLPAVDTTGIFLRKFLPANFANKLTRWKYLLQSFLFVRWCLAFPGAARKLLTFGAKKQLPASIPIDPHFKPSYKPWEQRLCMCPDGDFFAALRGGNTGIVTGTIQEVTAKGIKMESGEFIDADIIVTATGLKLLIGGGVHISVDDEPVKFNEKFLWNGMMLQDLPNVSVIIGYTNASWTLGSDATSRFTARLLKYMKAKNIGAAVPRLPNPDVLTQTPVLKMNSTYITTAKDYLPRAATQAPWMPRFNYFYDNWTANHGSFKGLDFTSAFNKNK